MKNLILRILAVSSIFSSASGYAQRTEPGQVQTFSGEAIIVSRILLDRSVKPCVEQIQNSVYQILMQNVTFQGLSPKTAKYQFHGIALEGGDMAVGNVTLTVTSSVETGIFGDPVTFYQCDVSLPTPRR